MSEKLPALRPKKLVKALQKKGFYIKRHSGGHAIVVSEKMRKAIPIPWHNKDLKTGTVHGIIRRAGLTPEEFKKLL